jgi:hypothetical protein
VSERHPFFTRLTSASRDFRDGAYVNAQSSSTRGHIHTFCFAHPKRTQDLILLTGTMLSSAAAALVVIAYRYLKFQSNIAMCNQYWGIDLSIKLDQNNSAIDKVLAQELANCYTTSGYATLGELIFLGIASLAAGLLTVLRMKTRFRRHSQWRTQQDLTEHEMLRSKEYVLKISSIVVAAVIIGRLLMLAFLLFD